MNRRINFEKDEKEILKQVPPNYYQEGVKNNFLQRVWHRGKLKAVLSLVENNPKNVLDVGCASGWFLFEIKKDYPKTECIGIDKYRDAIIYGNKKYKKIKLIYEDAHELPFKNNSFDLVICTEVLEHVKDPGVVLLEIKRVLKKDGIAILEMDSGNLLFRVAWYWWTNVRKGVWRHSHLHLFTARKLENIIKKAGFRIKKRNIFNFSMGIAFLLEKK